MLRCSTGLIVADNDESFPNFNNKCMANNGAVVTSPEIWLDDSCLLLAAGNLLLLPQGCAAILATENMEMELLEQRIRTYKIPSPLWRQNYPCFTLVELRIFFHTVFRFAFCSKSKSRHPLLGWTALEQIHLRLVACCLGNSQIGVQCTLCMSCERQRWIIQSVRT